MTCENFNPFSLADKGIVITGASSGIGQECAIICSKLGARLALIVRNQERLNNTLASLDGLGHVAIPADLTLADDMSSLPQNINNKIGKIDGIINSAGISTTLPFKLVSNDEMQRFFATNLFGAMNLTRELVKTKFSNNGASIIFIASIMGVVGERGKSLYSMTKGALIAATKSLSCELAKRSIRVNCISPGAILTPINAKLPHMADPELRSKLEAKHPLGLGHTEDIAYACAYLLSDTSRWVTGQNLIVDGGYTAQ